MGQMPSKQKILFTSVLGPYGIDSSRSSFKNPMSLLANQVTRGQKHYTVQLTQRTFAYDLFAVNVNADVAILDFPEEKQLETALESQSWDRIGTSAIIPNFNALVDTFDLIRKKLPNVPVDIGGHIANDEGVVKDFILEILKLYPHETFNIYFPKFEAEKNKNADEINEWLRSIGSFGLSTTIVKRDGLEYYSRLKGVGLIDDNKINAPLVDASFGKKLFGIPLPATSAGLIIPDVGCPKACNFCATSHKFDGRFVKFLNTAEDIMDVAQAHEKRGKTDFFVMSENFSLNTRRTLNLLSLMEERKKPYTYSVFSSADSLVKLGVENIVKLGYTFIWIGLEESSGTTFKKMHGINLLELINDLQAHGVEILGSTILGFEGQDERAVEREINHALKYNCVYNQFMLYMPIPGTAFHQEMKNAGKLRNDFPYMEMHGQSRQNWKHPKIDDQKMEKLLDDAFNYDYKVLGPSLFRMMSVHYSGYKKTQDWEHQLVQMRRKKMKDMFKLYVPILAAMEKDLKNEGHVVAFKVEELKENLMKELNFSGKMLNKALSPVVYGAIKLESLRYAQNMTKRTHPGPKSQLTIYGDMNFNLPAVEKCRKHGFVSIYKNRKPLDAGPLPLNLCETEC